jgi:pimeloyl-ACP methyl ester carboxylesterase
MTPSVFKSIEGRDKIRTYYNSILSRFSFEQLYIDTAYGKTFILSAGNKENPPVVLLHGSCSNSAFWFSELMALAAHFCVYAVDIIGEAGNSAEHRPDLTSDAYAVWLREVMDQLGLQKTILIGNSLGGWLALKLTAAFPERVAKLILIASSGIIPPRTAFIEKAVQALAQNNTLTVDASISAGNAMPPEVEAFINLILDNYIPITEALPVFTDAQLGKLNMPVLFIAGDKDIVIDAEKSAERLKILLPNTQVQLLKDGGHVVFNAIDYILPFVCPEPL